MTRFILRIMPLLVGIAGSGVNNATAQTKTFSPIEHLTFDSPEGWALKYFTSVSTMSGSPPPEPLAEQSHLGSITVGIESDWLPALNPARARVGFSGHQREDVNKTPIFVRPSVRIGLPWEFTAVVAAPPPIEVFGITPRLFDFGLERPLIQRPQWTLGWRASGQVGHVTGAFTCPASVLTFAPGSPGNPTGCVGSSMDSVSMRYGGTELQGTYRIPGLPRLSAHATAGFNYINSSFQVNAPVASGLDRTRLWTAGNTANGTAGLTYLLTNRVAFTVDAFYSPLFVRRVEGGPRTNDGLFNVRAMVTYAIR